MRIFWETDLTEVDKIDGLVIVGLGPLSQIDNRHQTRFRRVR
jgi:hypothetical protein